MEAECDQAVTSQQCPAAAVDGATLPWWCRRDAAAKQDGWTTVLCVVCSGLRLRLGAIMCGVCTVLACIQTHPHGMFCWPTCHAAPTAVTMNLTTSPLSSTSLLRSRPRPRPGSAILLKIHGLTWHIFYILNVVYVNEIRAAMWTIP